MGRQGGLQPIFPAALGRNAPRQGGKFQMDVGVNQPGQDGPGAVLHNQALKTGQYFRSRAHRGDTVPGHHHRPVPDGGLAYRQDPFTQVCNHFGFAISCFLFSVFCFPFKEIPEVPFSRLTL